MIRVVFIVLILFQTQSFARDWNKYYKLVNSDIKSVEALNSRDLGLKVRLFELYGEKLSLLIEKERDYRIKFLETGSNKSLNKLVKLQELTLKKLDRLGAKIERETKDRKIVTKVNYYRALNYLSTKQDKKFFFYMKKAEKTNRDPKIGYQINTKLANYYYNELNYKAASFYYKKLLNDEKSPWLSKHYYNLAWSELKLDRYKNALEYLKKSHFYEKQSGYYKIGSQLVDALLLFHAYAQQTPEGLEYFKSHNLDNFDNYLKYLHYVFGHGSRKDTRYVIDKIENMKLTPKQEYQFLEKKIVVYRALKMFTRLQKDFKKFKAKLSQKQHSSVEKALKDELVIAIKGYSGYLQELIRSKRLISAKRKRIYIAFIAYNFNVLRSINPQNALEYSFYEGETHLSIGDYRKASLVYARGIKDFKSKGKKTHPFLKKTFDSLFKALEKDRSKNTKLLLFSFKMYVYFYPRTKKSNEIYQRMIAIYRGSGDEASMLRMLRDYNRAFPKMVKVQRDFYKDVLNQYIDKKDINALRALQGLINKKFLGFGRAESLAIDKVIKQIRFSKYELLAKKGKVKEAISGFMKLYQDKKGKHSFRVDALRKVLYFQNQELLFMNLSDSLIESRAFFKPSDKKKYAKELLFYAQNICFGDYQRSCLKVLNGFIADKSLILPANLKNFHFKLRSLYSDNLIKDFLAAKTIKDKNFIFKLFLLNKNAFESKLASQFYMQPAMRSVLDGEANLRVLNLFYSTLDITKTKNYVSKFNVQGIRARHLKELVNLESILAKISFNIPKAPKVKIITEQIFVQYGQALESEVGKMFTKMQSLIESSSANYLPYVLTKIIIEFEKEVRVFKKFIPESNDPDFENAMTEAITNFHRIFDGKVIELRQLYFKSLNNTLKGSGAKKYNDNIMIKPKQNGYGKIKLWQD